MTRDGAELVGLRWRLADMIRQHDCHVVLRREHFDGADAVLSAIEAAGYRIVPPEAGAMCCVGGECWAHDGSEWAGWFEELLHPGDLGGTS